MQKVTDIMQALNIVPKLRLGSKTTKPDGSQGPVQSTGPHVVRFLEEPAVVMGKDENGQPRKEFRFIVEEKGKKYRWNVPILGKDSKPSYLIEHLEQINPGDVRTLELKSSKGRNYIEIRNEGVDQSSTSHASPEPEDEPEEIEEDDDQDEAEEQEAK
jgi:hypothetical protein